MKTFLTAANPFEFSNPHPNAGLEELSEPMSLFLVLKTHFLQTIIPPFFESELSPGNFQCLPQSYLVPRSRPQGFFSTETCTDFLSAASFTQQLFGISQEKDL